MKNIEFVKSAITYSGNNFEFYYLKHEILTFSKTSYDKIIIPTNGNIETYRNIEIFIKKYFNFKNIYYYKYPSIFIESRDKDLFYF